MASALDIAAQKYWQTARGSASHGEAFKAGADWQAAQSALALYDLGQHLNEVREWFAVLDTVEENEDGSISWAEGCISTHSGGNIVWQTEAISFVEKKYYDQLRERNEKLTAAGLAYAEAMARALEAGIFPHKGKLKAELLELTKEAREALAGEAMSADPAQPSHAPETKAAESEGGQPK